MEKVNQMHKYKMKAFCENCGRAIEVNTKTVEKESVKCLEDNKVLQLIYYVCNGCGKRHVVQVDDSDTMRLLRELTKLMSKAARYKHEYKDLSKKDVTKITKIRTDLAEKRLALKMEYQGKHYDDYGLTRKIEVSSYGEQ